MPDLLYPYLVGVISTLVVTLVAIWAFIVCYRRAAEYARREERLPLATRWEDLSEKVADLEEEWQRLRHEAQQATYAIEEADRAREFLEQHQAEMSQAKAEREHLERDRADLVQVKEELADARQQLEESEKERARAEFQRTELQEQAAGVEKQIAALKEQATKCTESLEQEQARLDEARADVTKATERLNNALRRDGEVREALAQAERRVAALEAEIRELAAQRDALREKYTELEEGNSELRTAAMRFKEQAAALEARAEHLGGRVDELRAEEKTRDRSLATSAEGLGELWQPVIELLEYAEPPETLEWTEFEALTRVRSYLRALGLRFPKRAVNAFHTSLKVARDTPLLVLAGISGTGKSLLPRRYAEAMGMHFLPVPVQPRWDGPQDLLGFFNYLENRYKATELVRALIQMDPMNREWIPEDYDQYCHERMLIVLLDEMNLARVEYYFSEFLSRLETRRDVLNLDNDADRVKAEIYLDAGRFGEDAECQVYVDTNVLFVGTINEDESKLALSDMVIDRANVMRFGRPQSLRLQARDGKSKPEKLRAPSYLPKEAWFEWVKKGEENKLPDDIENWIQELNDALARVGRPFGYRTRNAMRAYAQQYPDQSDEGNRMAMADQIEQRIMPKVRGVDVSEETGQGALEDVKKVVQQLGDQSLLDAVEKGMNPHDGHLFNWYGVDRPDDD